MRIGLLAAAALLLAGCGGHKAARLSFTPAPVPVYPGAGTPKVAVNPTFQSTDFTLPAGTAPTAVYTWYARALPKRGWKITQLNETGVHAEKGARTLDIGVRGRTLEVIQG